MPVKVRSCITYCVRLKHVCTTKFSDDTFAASAAVPCVIMFLLRTDLADSGRFAISSVDWNHYVAPVRCEYVWWVTNVNACNGYSFNLLKPSGHYMYSQVKHS